MSYLKFLILLLNKNTFSSLPMEKLITFQVFGPSDEVYNSFADLTIFGKFHPLIESVKISKQIDKSSTEYNILEKPFAWLPFKIKYKALVTLSNNKVVYNISDLPFTSGTITYNFKSIKSKNCTEIIFNLHLESKLPGKGILFNKMIKAQVVLMENLGNFLL